jgi:hypothetical protein
MSENEPTPPKGARLVGHLIDALGWLLFIAAAGIVVLMIVFKTFNVAGLVVALLVAGMGGIALVLGKSIEHSRAR